MQPTLDQSSQSFPAPRSPVDCRSVSPLSANWEVPPWRITVFEKKRSKYAVVIPVINESHRITAQLERMKPFLSFVDVFIVDGGSTDGATEDSRLSASGITAILRNAESRSSFCADLKIGFAHAMVEGYEGIILVDGNNKDNPSALPRFCEALGSGLDFVQGSRFLPGGKSENTPVLRSFAIRQLHAPVLSFVARFRYTDTTNGFRAFSRKFLLDNRVQPFRNIFAGYDLPYYLAVRAGEMKFKVTEIPVERAYPASGPIPTKITPIRGNLKMLGTLMRVCLHRLNP